MRKRSISIKGHRTSILLEPEFWATLEAAAHKRGVSLPTLIADIDQARLKSSPAPGLASALRVFALAEANKSGVGDEAR
jgi:predicted DNA-binding ribbon-helix-helix protein